MIKRYNQFVNGRINENIGEGFDEEEGDFIPGEEINPGFDEEEGDFEVDTQDEFMGEEEEEGGDIFKMRLKELADLLGTDVMNNTIEYNGKTIIFPSETEMYHVDRKKFKTAQEVYDYLTGDLEDITAPKMQKEIQRELELTESKSYRNTRLNKRRK